MRTLLTALTALMLFVTPLVAGDLEDGIAAYEVGNYQNAYRLLKPLAERGNASAQAVIGWMYRAGKGVPEDDTKAVHWWRTSARPRI
jgi:TPR repeat protein